MSSVAEKLQRRSRKAVATKQVRLKLVYVDFWSAVKLSFLVAVSLGIILVVATVMIYLLLQSSAIFTTIDDLVQDLLGGDAFSIERDFSLSRVSLFAVIAAILNIAVGTVLGAITCLLYNLSVRITGGVLVGFTNN